MTAFFIYTPEQLAALKQESPQHRVDLFSESKSAGLFTENGILRRYPILIPGWHRVDYPEAVYGVNADETAGVGVGWWVLIPSYLLMDALDTVRLYMGKRLEPGQVPDPLDPGTLIKTIVIPVDHDNQNVVSFIPRSAVEKPGIHKMWYTIERVSGNDPEISDPIIVWFKPTFPDCLDPSGNSRDRLPLEAPRFPALIDKAMVAAGVDFIVPAWPIMTVGDRVLLTVAHLTIDYVIKREQIGQDIVIFVSPAILSEIGHADPLLASYVVIDQVHNASLTSSIGVGALDPDTTYLEAASVQLAIDDTLAIDDLNGMPMKVDVLVRRADVVAGDKVELSVFDPATGFSEVFGRLITGREW